MKKMLALLLIFMGYSSFAFAQKAEEKKAPEEVAPMKTGILDMAGDKHTIAKAWLSPKGGWTPFVYVIVYFPGYEQEDALVLQLKKGVRKWANPLFVNLALG